MKLITLLIISLFSSLIFANEYQLSTEPTFTSTKLYFAKDLNTADQCLLKLTHFSVTYSDQDHGTIEIKFPESSENCLGVIEFGFGTQLPKLIPSDYYLIINGVNYGVLPIYPLKGHETDNG
jgi:hypothetical protein